jgi:hypothetical protein
MPTKPITDQQRRGRDPNGKPIPEIPAGLKKAREIKADREKKKIK